MVMMVVVMVLLAVVVGVVLMEMMMVMLVMMVVRVTSFSEIPHADLPCDAVKIQYCLIFYPRW